MKKTNRLGIVSITLSAIGALGYTGTFFFSFMRGHYSPLFPLLPVAILCSIGGIVTGALGLKPVRVLNLIGLILGVLLLIIPIVFIIIVMIYGL